MTKDEALSAKHEGATTVALKLALEALGHFEKAGLATLKTIDAITAIREALAQPEYASEADTEELLKLNELPEPLRLAAMLEKTMQWPLHGKSADCLHEMYDLLKGCETEMRYAGWDKREADNPVRSDLYEEVKSLLEKNT